MEIQNYGPPPGLSQRSNKEKCVNHGHLELPNKDLVLVCGSKGEREVMHEGWVGVGV